MVLMLALMFSIVTKASEDPKPKLPTKAEVLKGDYVTFKYDATKAKFKQLTDLHCASTLSQLTGYMAAWAILHPGVTIIDEDLGYSPPVGPIAGFWCWTVTYENNIPDVE